jgi:LacI family transcriptional regulator
MTSVKTNAHGVGYRAASMLDRLMAEMPVDPRVAEVEPIEGCTRQSTDIVAIEDPDIATALEMIRREACDGIKVTEILNRIPMSRRAFETLFKKLVGRTAHEEILRIKLAHAKRLLAESELSLTQVAHRTGFNHTSYMSEVFQKKVGRSRSKYREDFHGK